MILLSLQLKVGLFELLILSFKHLLVRLASISTTTMASLVQSLELLLHLLLPDRDHSMVHLVRQIADVVVHLLLL